MKLGDFFKSAPFARPVNPRPVTFTATTRNTILPGGTSNPNAQQISAQCTGAYVFLGGEGTEEATVEARKYLAQKFVDEKTKLSLPVDATVFNTEFVYQMFWRVVYEWDEANQRVMADRLFPSVDNVRELVLPSEADRVVGGYFKYVKEEHPEGVDQDTFRGSAK